MDRTRARIRPYRPGDLDALYRICLLTGDAGHDATSLSAPRCPDQNRGRFSSGRYAPGSSPPTKQRIRADQPDPRDAYVGDWSRLSEQDRWLGSRRVA